MAAEKKMLYLECSSGISGDMAVAALLDLGTPEEKAAREAAVLEVLGSLPVQGFEIRISRVEKSGLDACDFDVVLDAAHENHDHDMEYLYGHVRDEERGHVHGGEHDHSHEHAHVHEDGTVQVHSHVHEDGDCDHHHSHSHSHAHKGGEHSHSHTRSHSHGHAHGHAHAHHHEHRNLADVLAIIDGSCATEGAKQIAHDIFAVIAKAEAKAHGKPIDEVHFHEVGAVDSIADILAFAVCLDHLAVSEVVVTELAEGKGTVRCQHGIIPVPVPAVVNIISEYDIPLHMLDIQGELVTPTGAAIVAAARTKTQLPERFTIKQVGIGAGKREYETPGVVRAILVEER